MSMFSFQAIHNQVWQVCSVPIVVYRLCQCSLFKQFTTPVASPHSIAVLFIDYVNVLFSSNSQRRLVSTRATSCCLSIMSMFSFQAIGRVRNRLNNLSPVGRGLGVAIVNLSSLLFSILQRRRGILSPALLVVFTTE